MSAVVCLRLHARRVNYFLINRLFRFARLMALADYHRQRSQQPAASQTFDLKNKMAQYSRSHADRLRYTLHRLSSTFIIMYLFVSYDDDDERRTSHACILHICPRIPTTHRKYDMHTNYTFHVYIPYVDYSFFQPDPTTSFFCTQFFAQNTSVVVHDRRSVDKTFNKNLY